MAIKNVLRLMDTHLGPPSFSGSIQRHIQFFLPAMLSLKRIKGFTFNSISRVENTKSGLYLPLYYSINGFNGAIFSTTPKA